MLYEGPHYHGSPATYIYIYTYTVTHITNKIRATPMCCQEVGEGGITGIIRRGDLMPRLAGQAGDETV